MTKKNEKTKEEQLNGAALPELNAEILDAFKDGDVSILENMLQEFDKIDRKEKDEKKMKEEKVANYLKKQMIPGSVVQLRDGFYYEVFDDKEDGIYLHRTNEGVNTIISLKYYNEDMKHINFRKYDIMITFTPCYLRDRIEFE